MISERIAKVELAPCGVGLSGKVMGLFWGAGVKVRVMMNSGFWVLAGKRVYKFWGNRMLVKRVLKGNGVRELPEADMKEILHQRMFETGTYKSLLGHVALYEALEASMEQANRDEFLAENDKSRKRRRDDQDPPSPPPDSNPKTPSISSKQQHAPHSEQRVEDVSIPDDVNISDSKDIDAAHLPKIKRRPDWLKPVPEEDRPKTPEPYWIIPLIDLPEAENN
nr:hypothetical protein [Tanacetum cinerariifolium]